MRKILPTLFILLSGNAISNDDFSWLTPDGNKAPETENQKSKSGFGGWLVVTPDKDWEEKWNTPSENIPYFSEAKDVKLGEELTILPFFANPKLNESNYFEILCDIKVEKPDGTYSINEKNIPCAKGKLDISPLSVFLTQTVIKYIGEQGDPYGVWTVYFDMKDSIRGINIPLKTSFNLVK
ncbi:hypothetical protein [Pseudoalteromonas sp. M8]|uniref:hypothetical protein n=1 Tax=Pseudoalteromonas sp. M8 TaxID=2692624 RepID=UPI001BA99C49|nr:hypothetical protein [Pseudoalteromonas sp. M8]QUI68493.1 hypothetical protein GSF13_01300 [Pseudoalteromonas sp. M8]